jgi:adenylate cyclase
LNNTWKEKVTESFEYKQGYLTSDNKRSIRIRTSTDKAWLNIKSASIGTHRQEYEYEIPFKDGMEILLTLCQKPLIEKIRYLVPYQQHLWEIDIFSGDNEGLIVAEIELSNIGESFAKPNWVGKEVTMDLRYYNNNLCKLPYKKW